MLSSPWTQESRYATGSLLDPWEGEAMHDTLENTHVPGNSRPLGMLDLQMH
jgi:hypothetical protein